MSVKSFYFCMETITEQRRNFFNITEKNIIKKLFYLNLEIDYVIPIDRNLFVSQIWSKNFYPPF